MCNACGLYTKLHGVGYIICFMKTTFDITGKNVWATIKINGGKPQVSLQYFSCFLGTQAPCHEERRYSDKEKKTKNLEQNKGIIWYVN